MSVFVHTINSVSSIFSIIDEEYYIESKYCLNFDELKSMNNLKIKLNEIGYIAGELNKNDKNDISIHMSNISHVITDIDVCLSIQRKMKLKKIEGLKIIDPFNSIVKIRILDTQSGNMMKMMMDNWIETKTYLNCIKDDHNNTIKIITENIES